MNILYIYPSPVTIQDDGKEGFIDLAGSEKWMPSLTIKKGYPAELWAVGNRNVQTHWQYDDLPSLPVRVFSAEQSVHTPDVESSPPYEAGKTNGKHDQHIPLSLIRALQSGDFDFFVLQGLNSALAVSLAKQHLLAQNRPFAVIHENNEYNRILSRAVAVCYNTTAQKEILSRRGIRFWRKPVSPDKLIQLPKSVDTRHFQPDLQQEKKWDLLGMCQTMDDEKRLAPLFQLSRRHRVAIAGKGPLLGRFEKKYPEINWLGDVSYAERPGILNSSRVFFHCGLNDPFPMPIVEAAACGVPPVVFSEAVEEEIIPEKIGLRIPGRSFSSAIATLLEDRATLEKMSRDARKHACEKWHHLSSKETVTRLLQHVHAALR